MEQMYTFPQVQMEKEVVVRISQMLDRHIMPIYATV